MLEKYFKGEKHRAQKYSWLKCFLRVSKIQISYFFLSWFSNNLSRIKMATHSSILAWRIPWTKSLAGYSP